MIHTIDRQGPDNCMNCLDAGCSRCDEQEIVVEFSYKLCMGGGGMYEPPWRELEVFDFRDADTGKEIELTQAEMDRIWEYADENAEADMAEAAKWGDE